MSQYRTTIFIVAIFLVLMYGNILLAKGSSLDIKIMPTPTLTPTIEPTATPTPTPGVPLQLYIPKIGLETAIEQVGTDDTGKMDVPQNADDAGWYKDGTRPGMIGSAVIDGHLDKVDGSPAAFWNIAKLEPGDTINVAADDGIQYSFVVTRKQTYPFDQVPLDEVFTINDQPRLNLITCQGWWNGETHNYSDRIVIYSELVH